MAIIGNSATYLVQVAGPRKVGDNRVMFLPFHYVHSDGADAGTINLMLLPPGRVRIIPSLSRIVRDAYANPLTMTLGVAAYKAPNKVTVAAVPDALSAALEDYAKLVASGILFTAVSSGATGAAVTLALIHPDGNEANPLGPDLTVTDSDIVVGLSTSDNGVKASFTAGEGNQGIIFRWNTPGTTGNTKDIRLMPTALGAGHENRDLDIEVVDDRLQIILGTDGDGNLSAAKNTAALIVAAINAGTATHGFSAALVGTGATAWSYTLPGSTASPAIMATNTARALVGGVKASVLTTRADLIEVLEEDEDAAALVIPTLVTPGTGGVAVGALAETALALTPEATLSGPDIIVNSETGVVITATVADDNIEDDETLSGWIAYRLEG
jgi:hypothetical protein